MSGVLRLGNTGAGTGRSTLVAAASNDQTFTLPSAGGTLLTSNTSIPGGTITLDGATINITNGDLNVDSGTLFVDESTNRVGIGTITPEAALQIDAGAGGDVTLNLRMGTANSGQNESIISWANSAGSEIFKTYFVNSISPAEFRVAATLGGAGDIVFVKRSGEVGIGASPTDGIDLHVINNGAVQLRIDNTSGAGNAQLELVPGGRTEPWYTYASSNGDYVIQDNSAVRFRIDDSGNAAFSSQNPTAKLSLQTASSGAYALDIRGTATKQWGFYYNQNNWLNSTFRIDEFNSNGTSVPRLSIVAGEVGIGTDIPDEKLHVSATGDIKGKVTSTSGSNAGLILNSETVNNSNWIMQTGPAASGGLRFYNIADGTERYRINTDGSSTWFTSHTNVLISRSANASGTANSIFTGVNSATTNQNGSVCYRIYTNGTTQAFSDKRQKKNIETTRSGYLEDLNRLRVVKYNWKAQNDDEPKELGLIAQEVEEVFPGLVSDIQRDSEEERKGIKTSVIPFMLLKALQELTARTEALESEVSKLRLQSK